jgi:hypothetical protein
MPEPPFVFRNKPILLQDTEKVNRRAQEYFAAIKKPTRQHRLTDRKEFDL